MAAAFAFAAGALTIVSVVGAAFRAVAERDAANASLRAVLEGIGEPFCALDADWRVLHASRAALAF